jgi:hypothetical protein
VRPEVLPVFLLNCIMGDQMTRLLFPSSQPPTWTSCAPRSRGPGPVPARRKTLSHAHFCHLFYTDFANRSTHEQNESSGLEQQITLMNERIKHFQANPGQNSWTP